MRGLFVFPMLLAPWAAGIFFVRAVLAAVRKQWRVAASAARAATLLSVTITIGYAFVTMNTFYDDALGVLINMPAWMAEHPLWTLETVGMLASVTLSLALGVASSVLWFAMVAKTMWASSARR